MADDNTPQAPPAANDEGFLHSLATSLGIDPEAVKSTAKSILAHPVQTAEAVGSEAGSEAAAALKHPLDTAKGALEGAVSAATNPEAQETAKARFNQPGIGNKVAGATEYLTSGVPLVGGNLVKSEEQAAQGNVSGSMGTLAGTVAPALTGEAEELPENIHRAGAEARANIDARSAARLDEARTGKVLTVEPEKPSAQLKEVPKQLEGLRVQLHPKEIAENQGLVYKGELFPDSGVHQFEHPDHPGQTAALKEPITPEALKAKMASKVQEFQEPHITFNEIGGKEVQAPPTKSAAPVDMSPAYGDTGRNILAASKPEPPAEAPAAPAYHPDLQSLANTYGVSSDASRVKNGGSFITPDGKFIHLGADTHDMAIARNAEDRPPAGVQGATEDNRSGFLKDTGAIRTRFTKGRAGNELAISVPAAGVTPEQVSAIRQAVGQGLGRNGNLAIEVGEKNGEFTRKEFASPSDVEPMLQKIGVHPDQHEDSLVAGEMQSPLKGDYSVRVAHGDGTETVEKVPAFSGQDALKQIQQKFPKASAWGIEQNSEGYYRPEPKAPSTEYTVPNKKLASIPSQGKEPVAVIRHELGHALIGYQHGLETDGVLRHTHPDVKGRAVAAVKWRTGGLTDRAGKVKPEALPTIVHSLMGGIAADEVFNNIPRGTNHNFDPTVVGSDAHGSMFILKELGYSQEDAADILHKAIDANKEYLSKPEVSSVVKENENVREPDLSNQYHYSPERLQNMHREIQRRIGNAKNTEQPNNGAVSAENAGEREANVSSGKGGGAEEPGQNLQAHEVAKPEVSPNKTVSAISKSSKDEPIHDNGWLDADGKFHPLLEGESHPAGERRLELGGTNAIRVSAGNNFAIFTPTKNNAEVRSNLIAAIQNHPKFKTVEIDFGNNYQNLPADEAVDWLENGARPGPTISSQAEANKTLKVAPNTTLQSSAQKYAKANGMPEIDHSPVKVDPDQAKEIAKIYDEAQHDPNNPQVKAAYDALKSETLAQFNHLRNDLGLKFEPQESDPYASAGEMMNDIKQNNRLKVFTGSGPGADHPLSEVEPKTGQTYNTLFRWVHDALGHAAGGNDFSEAGGEERHGSPCADVQS